MTPGSHPVLRLAGVEKSFPSPSGSVAVLRGVDLCVQPGEFVMITGPSGSGKTTLLHLAALLDRPTAGRVIFDGRDTADMDEAEMSAARGRHVGMVFQKFHLLPHRSALANGLFRFRYAHAPAGDPTHLARRALAEVGLDAVADRTARLLSAGEMQRVAIARAVALRPRLLLADEPTGNLDQASAEAVMGCFRKLNAEGIAILMATHNDALVASGSRHLVCRGGMLAGAGAQAERNA